MSERLEVCARIRLKSAESGGRHTGIGSSYRPRFYLGDRQSDGAIFLDNDGWLQPGEECDGRIWFVHPEAFGEKLQPQTVLEFKEGTKVVGWATVLEK